MRLWTFLREEKWSRTAGCLISSLIVIIDLVLLPKDFLKLKALTLMNYSLQVVYYKTMQLLLAVAALEDLDIQSIDVKTVYLYGDLDEEIYIEQPEGFKLSGKENKVW